MAKGQTPTAEAPAETTPAPPVQKREVSIETLADLGKEIADLDTKIASASGSDVAAKKALVESLATENAERIQGGVTQIVGALQDVPLEVLVGLVTRLEEAIKAEFGAKITTFVDEKYAATGSATKEEAAKLRESRKALVTKFKAMRTVLDDVFGFDTSHIPDPKRSGGGRPAGSGGGGGGSAKTGMNKEGYRYLIDGKPRPGSQNSFSSVTFYATKGCPTSDGSPRWTSEKLREFIKEQGVNFGEDQTWEVTLPNNKKVSARKFTEQDKIELGFAEDSAPSSDDGAAQTTATEAAPVA